MNKPLRKCPGCGHDKIMIADEPAIRHIDKVNYRGQIISYREPHFDEKYRGFCENHKCKEEFYWYQRSRRITRINN